MNLFFQIEIVHDESNTQSKKDDILDWKKYIYRVVKHSKLMVLITYKCTGVTKLKTSLDSNGRHASP